MDDKWPFPAQSAVGERLVAEAALSCCTLPRGRQAASEQQQEDNRVAVEWTKECAHKLEAAEDVRPPHTSHSQ